MQVHETARQNWVDPRRVVNIPATPGSPTPTFGARHENDSAIDPTSLRHVAPSTQVRQVPADGVLTMKVYQAIGAVSHAMSTQGISKSRTNTQGAGYKFRGIDDVLNALAPALVASGLVILPRCTERVVEERATKAGGAMFNVTCRVEFDLVSTEDGSKHTVCTYGEAMDSADKATNKAMSAAYKYLALLVFCIPTEATAENDADFSTHDTKPREGDTSTKATASRIMVGVSAGDAAGAAAAMSEWEPARLDAVWALLDAKTTTALSAQWPKEAAA